MCANTGYRGRVALTELLVMTEITTDGPQRGQCR